VFFPVQGNSEHYPFGTTKVLGGISQMLTKIYVCGSVFQFSGNVQPVCAKADRHPFLANSTDNFKALSIMDAPITSEIDIESGMVLKEIATGQLFVVGERVKHGHEVSGEDIWNITPAASENTNRSSLVLSRNELSEKYFAAVED
jgi:hypothetical protein